MQIIQTYIQMKTAQKQHMNCWNNFFFIEFDFSNIFFKRLRQEHVEYFVASIFLCSHAAVIQVEFDFALFMK